MHYAVYVMTTGSKRGVILKPQLVGTTHNEPEYYTVNNKINGATFFREVSSFALYCFGCWHSTDVIEVLMQSSGEPIHLQPAHISPVRLHFFQSRVCSQALVLMCCSLASLSSFILGEISCSRLDFTARKPNTREPRARGNEWMRRGPAGNLTTKCEGVTLSLCSLAAVRAFSERESWTSVCTVACQKSLRCVKSHNICTQRAGHETQLFAFP